MSSAKDEYTQEIELEASSDDGLTNDEKTLIRLGYTPEFKRELGLWSIFSVSFSVIGLLPSVAATLFYGIGYIGLPGISWGWPIACSAIICVSLAMAELCSSMPTSGGLYYAGAVLAPPGWKALAAWTIGWSNWLAQITWAPSVNYTLANLILALAQMKNPDFVPEKYQVFLIALLLMLVNGILGSVPTKYVAKINSFGSTLNGVVIIIGIIMLLAGNKREDPKWNSNYQVWQQFNNQIDWPDGIAVLMSFLAAIWCIAGFDGPFHLAEECSNASTAAPISIVLTTVLASIFGWVLMLIIAYTIVDLDAVVNSDIGQPFATYCYQLMGTDAAMGLLALIVICLFFTGQACVVTASRVAYAYARDGCFPFSKFWSQVNKTTKTPVRCVWGNVTIGSLILLLTFNTEAISAIFSLGGTAAYVAFTIPTLLKLFSEKRFKPGPWNLGKFSAPVGIYACSFVLLMVPILSFPQVRGADLNAQYMNWTCLIYYGPMAIALLWYAIDARKWFEGPKVSKEHFFN